jgi:hypothetical protein
VAKYSEPATKPRTVQGKGTTDRTIYAALAIGFVIGVSLAGVILFGLFTFGALPIIEQQYLPAPTCPPTEFILPVCPTQPPIGGAGATPVPPTATMTPSPTLDLAATATVACATFSSQFPATPCP